MKRKLKAKRWRRRCAQRIKWLLNRHLQPNHHLKLSLIWRLSRQKVMHLLMVTSRCPTSSLLQRKRASFHKNNITTKKRSTWSRKDWRARNLPSLTLIFPHAVVTCLKYKRRSSLPSSKLEMLPIHKQRTTRLAKWWAREPVARLI